jgi:lipopolysaccharide transport system permease protein
MGREPADHREPSFHKGHSQGSSLRRYIDLVLTLTQKEIKIRYKNSLLGYFWSLANPLASAVVLYLAIQVFLRVEMENYVIFLIIGLFAWQWFSNYVVGSCTVFVANASLIKKTVFPRFVLPIALNLQDAFHFIMSIPIIVGFLLYHNVALRLVTLGGSLIVIPAQFLFLLGIGLALSSINLFLRDVERIVPILLNMMFFLSPVIYPIDRVPQGYQTLIWINPMTPIIEAWRSIFLEAIVPWDLVALAYVNALIAMLLGSWIYRCLSWRFAEAL